MSTTLSIDDIVNDHTVILQRESDTAVLLNNSLVNIDPLELKPKLLEWATTRFASPFPVLTLSVDVPNVCSDGVVRSILAYVEFCMNRSISSVLTDLSSKFPGMSFGYQVQERTLIIVVMKN